MVLNHRSWKAPEGCALRGQAERPLNRNQDFARVVLSVVAVAVVPLDDLVVAALGLGQVDLDAAG